MLLLSFWFEIAMNTKALKKLTIFRVSQPGITKRAQSKIKGRNFRVFQIVLKDREESPKGNKKIFWGNFFDGW